MKEQLKHILEAMHKYNSSDMVSLVFNLSKDVNYDAIVIAPTFTPSKLKLDENYKITALTERPSYQVFLLERENYKIAWVNIGASDSNLIDYLGILAETNAKKFIFIGAVGALKKEVNIGDVCTPIYSIAGAMAHTYLKSSIKDFVPFEKYELEDKSLTNKLIDIAKSKGYSLKPSTVFCTPTCIAEYAHLDEIKEFDTDLIEMETASFIALMNMIEKPSAILLVVSDNSCSGVPLVGRSQEQEDKYNYGRRVVLPELIFEAVKL